MIARWTLCLGLIAGPAWADVLPACSAQTAVGAACWLSLDQLRPTQPGVGLLQVADESKKLAKLQARGDEALTAYVVKKHIPVVIGPDGGFWLVDRHHLSRALWNNGVRQAPVSIAGRLENADTFWQDMQARHWAWLRDERGNMVAPSSLPKRIGDVPDDPYRSLAGYAEDQGLFRKNGQVFFIEFAWARYLGEKLGWAPVTRDTLKQRLQEARQWACQPEAAGLPGYPGAACH